MIGNVSERVILASFVSIIILAYVFASVAWTCPECMPWHALMLAIFSGETEAEEDRANEVPAEEMEKCVGPSVGRCSA